MRALLLVLLSLGVSACAGDGSGDPGPGDAAETRTAKQVPARTAPRDPRRTSTREEPRAPREDPKPVVVIEPLPRSLKAQLEARGFWEPRCPVPLSDLRRLTVPYWGFDRQVHAGQLIVNERAARPLGRVFKQLYRMRFPIRHMTIPEFYGPRRLRPPTGDATASFECRQAVPSPCTGGSGTGSWSNHAYGLAVDINPVENPYVGCGQSRDPAAWVYRDRSRHRRGMITPRVIEAFASIGWEWGGSWSGPTKDYMHFSETGH